MDITSIIFQCGFATYVEDVVTPLPTSAAATNFQVGKNLPEDVGFIYGLSTYADGLDAEGRTLISTTQAQGIYLTLQEGPTQFIQQVRMDDLLNTFAGSPVVRPQKFTPVNIPVFDLSKSFYSNPNSYFGANTSIHLKLWYINQPDFEKYKKMVQ